MSVYEEYETFKAEGKGDVGAFLKYCLEKDRIEESAMLAGILSDVIDKATENLRLIIRVPELKDKRMRDVLHTALEKIGNAEPTRERDALFGMLVKSTWRDFRNAVDDLAGPSASPAEKYLWEKSDPSKAVLSADADCLTTEVASYLRDVSCSRDAMEFGRIARDFVLREGAGETPNFVKSAITSSLLSEEESDLKKVTALDFFLRLMGKHSNAEVRQVLAVKAAQDAFVRVNDLKAAFKRLEAQAKMRMRRDGRHG